MLSKVDFPAPDGPMMAVSSPDFKRPLTDFRIFLAAKREHAKHINKTHLNSQTTYLFCHVYRTIWKMSR